jgi:hypothetical protein
VVRTARCTIIVTTTAAITSRSHSAGGKAFAV